MDQRLGYSSRAHEDGHTAYRPPVTASSGSSACSPTLDSAMFHGPSARIHPFVITCKRCKENIAAPVHTMSDSWIIHTCPLGTSLCAKFRQQSHQIVVD